MPREKGFSEEQNQKKQELISKYGYVLLEDIKGDILIKDPSKFDIETKDGARFQMPEMKR